MCLYCLFCYHFDAANRKIFAYNSCANSVYSDDRPVDWAPACAFYFYFNDGDNNLFSVVFFSFFCSYATLRKSLFTLHLFYNLSWHNSALIWLCVINCVSVSDLLKKLCALAQLIVFVDLLLCHSLFDCCGVDQQIFASTFHLPEFLLSVT